MLRRSALIFSIVSLLGILQPWCREACAADPAGTAAPPAEASVSHQPVVTAIGVVKSKAGTQITISGEGDLGYEYFLIEGKNLAIDIPGATSTVWPAEQQVDDEFVNRVQVAAPTGEKPGVRVVLSLKKPNGFSVRGENGRIVIAFTSRDDVASASRPALNRVVEVLASRIANAFRVAVVTDAQPSYRVLDSGDPKRITVAIDGATLEPNARKASDYSNLDTPVTRISTWSERKDAPVVMVVIDLRQPRPFHVFTDAHGLNVDLSIALTGAASPVAPPPLAPAPTPDSPLASAPAAASVAEADPGYVARSFTGRKITLDFQDAEITDIFRLIADISGMNIVATDDVKGKRSVKMTDVPWDQALDLILKTNIPQLVQIGESETIIRVTTQQRLLDDQAAAEKRRLEQLQRALAEQKQGLEKAEFSRKLEAENQKQLLEKVKSERQRSKGWLEKTFTVSYGDTGEVAKRLEKFASGCKDGCVFESGERSKTIFVRDFVDNVAQMSAVFDALESPTAAVMVEARIVQVTSDASENIGIQWGANYVADAAHGNATRYAFPNTIGIGGTQGTENYLVNLPVAGAPGVGLSLGHVADTFNLDVRLSALESLSKIKILSNPKVLVVQNEEANIARGDQLPVFRTDATGNRTVEWKDVGIVLKVTPTVTSDGRVFMKVMIEESSQGPDVNTGDGLMFSITRRGAETKVLVGDGETTVIGGIFQQTDSNNSEGVPGLSRLPVIGWLFKSKSSGNNRRELMIFLTPRIVNASIDRHATDHRDQSSLAQSGSPADAATVAPADSRGVYGTVSVLNADVTPSGNAVKAVVRYTNDTTFTFASSVTINCRAIGPEGKVIGADNGYILARDSGPLAPNFQMEKVMSFPLEAKGYTELRCVALEAE